MSEPSPPHKETPEVSVRGPLDLRTSRAEVEVIHSARIDARRPGPGERVEDRNLPHHSSQWARIVGPFTWFVLSLIALVMLLPFSMLWLISFKRVPLMLDWAKTILPSATGFGGAIIGY